MENKDQKLIQSIVLANKRFKNQQFADFIIQSNKIQIYLSQLVILRSSYPDKEFEEKIESGTEGQIINLFCACAKKEIGEISLIPKLRQHNKIRNNFAHKIYTIAGLKKDELKKAVLLGNFLIINLTYILNEETKAIKLKNP